MNSSRQTLCPVTCPTCGKTFQPRTSTRRFCCVLCANEAKRSPALTEPIEEKKCSHCKQVKAAAHFHLSPKGTTGLASWCKECMRARPRHEKMLEYNCEDCGQLLRKVYRSSYDKVNTRKVCLRCSMRRRIGTNGGRTLNYTGSEFFSGKTIGSWKLSAKKRNHIWDLTHEQLDRKFREQDSICALSGVKMGGGHSSPYRPSIDRIDSAGDYVEGNFQFVCSIVNVMKNKIDEPLFIELCLKISQHRLEKGSS